MSKHVLQVRGKDSGLDCLRSAPWPSRSAARTTFRRKGDHGQHVPHQLRFLRSVQVFIRTGDFQRHTERRQHHIPHDPCPEPSKAFLVLDQQHRTSGRWHNVNALHSPRRWSERPEATSKNSPATGRPAAAFPSRAICRSRSPSPRCRWDDTRPYNTTPSTSGSFPAQRPRRHPQYPGSPCRRNHPLIHPGKLSRNGQA